MSKVRQLLRAMAAGGLVVAALAGCSGDDGTPDGGAPAITLAMMQAGVLQPTDIGPTWTRPQQTPPTTSLIPFCGAPVTRPPVPGEPSAIASSLVDEGEKGAQTFDQTGLVYPDTETAQSTVASLRATAEACPPAVSRTAEPRQVGVEPANTENTTIEPLTSNGWSGFVVLRHKVYAATSPGVADTAVVVLAQENAVVVASYGIYWVGRQATGPEFTTNWRRLVGTVLSRVDEKRGG